MPLYKQNNAAELAQSAMSGATQAMAAQTKETGTRTEKESNFWDDLNKGAAAVAYVGRGLDGLTKAADGAWEDTGIEQQPVRTDLHFNADGVAAKLLEVRT